MISWIKGKVISLWQVGNKSFVLINCQDIGYEIQILDSVFKECEKNKIINKDIILWLKHIKKEDSDSLFGFSSKDQKDLFVEILSIKGIGSQIGMTLLNKFSIKEIINAIVQKDKKLISSVPGIGQKMTERILLELKSNIIKKLNDPDKIIEDEFNLDSKECNEIIKDIELTLQSLKYPKKEIKKIIPMLIKDIKTKDSKIRIQKMSFENLLKETMNYLDKNSSNLDQ